MKSIVAFVLASYLAVTSGNPNSNGDTLSSMHVNRDKITLSGFSSGGTFAQQLQFSYSSLFSGIAVFSHTFYRCGPPNGSVDAYDRVCTMLGELPASQYYSPDLVHADIADYRRRNIIEDPANLKGKRLYVYTGLQNTLFTPGQSLGILKVYERYIGSLQHIYTRVQDSNIIMPTDSTTFGIECTATPDFEADRVRNHSFIGKCGFSAVTEALNFLLFENSNPTPEAFYRYNTPRGKVSTFDQTRFTQGLSKHQLDTVGFYYVPKRCQGGSQSSTRCYLHFYFHGCLSGREFVSTDHIENTGLLELADRKGIIMIFPQALSSLPENDIGCWDTFGVSGKDYATQSGDQIKAVKRMIDTIIGVQRPASSAYRPSSGGQRQVASNLITLHLIACLAVCFVKPTL